MSSAAWTGARRPVPLADRVGAPLVVRLLAEPDPAGQRDGDARVGQVVTSGQIIMPGRRGRSRPSPRRKHLVLLLELLDPLAGLHPLRLSGCVAAGEPDDSAPPGSSPSPSSRLAIFDQRAGQDSEIPNSRAICVIAAWPLGATATTSRRNSGARGFGTRGSSQAEASHVRSRPRVGQSVVGGMNKWRLHA
jgi:hypothetical protein